MSFLSYVKNEVDVTQYFVYINTKDKYGYGDAYLVTHVIASAIRNKTRINCHLYRLFVIMS